MINIVVGLLLPLLGTVLGAACVFFMRGELCRGVQNALSGFAAGIMVAASVWSLLLPALDHSADYGRLRFVPAALGLVLGMFFLWGLDILIPRLYTAYCQKGDGSMLVLAVTLHNLPEGMAVGAVFAGLLAGEPGIFPAGAMALSAGIAIQNFPEGAIISLPCHSRGNSRGRAFYQGAVSGIVEPIGAMLTILATGVVLPVLPYLLGFAAGAMLYVVVVELVPDMAEQGGAIGPLMFAAGFSLMMALDVALG